MKDVPQIFMGPHGESSRQKGVEYYHSIVSHKEPEGKRATGGREKGLSDPSGRIVFKDIFYGPTYECAAIRVPLVPATNATPTPLTALLIAKGVLAVPGTAFMPLGGPTPYVRVSFSVVDEERAEEACKRLREAILEARGEETVITDLSLDSDGHVLLPPFLSPSYSYIPGWATNNQSEQDYLVYFGAWGVGLPYSYYAKSKLEDALQVGPALAMGKSLTTLRHTQILDVLSRRGVYLYDRFWLNANLRVEQQTTLWWFAAPSAQGFVTEFNATTVPFNATSSANKSTVASSAQQSSSASAKSRSATISVSNLHATPSTTAHLNSTVSAKATATPSKKRLLY
ncbi:hypothetical protein DFH06DRAFT_1291641 [Mycena polygramma]|nr:hypothetical protein DFH06DRAFT_1291641 [Mycena polygramma]